jgi:hypothetical protein
VKNTEQHSSGLPYWWWLVPLLLLAAWLGFRGLNADAIWYDEWLSVYYAGGAQYGPISIPEIWARVAERSTWPPGFQTMLGGWGALVGWSNLAARMLPLLVGLLAIAWMYRLGRDTVSRRAGLAAAVFIGGSAFFAYYLHELRGYTLYALFSAMLLWAYWRLLHGRVSLATQLTFLVGVVGVLYTHYFAALAAVAVGLYHLLFVRKNRAWWRVPILMVVGAVLFLPWAQVAFSTASDALTNEERRIVPLHAGELFATLLYGFSNGIVALVVVLALASLLAWRRYRRALLLAWVWLACVLGIALLANERLRVIFHIRHLMAVWPALALVCALGVEALARRGVRPLVVLGLWLAVGVWVALDPAFINNLPGQERTLNWDDLSAALDVVRRESTDEDDVLLYHVDLPGREWLQEPVVDYYSEPLGLRHNQLEEIPGLQPNDDYFWQLIGWLDGAPHVWMVTLPDVPSPYHLDEFARVMAIDYAFCRRPIEREGLTLDLYARQPRLRDEPRWDWNDDTIELFTLSEPPQTVDTMLDLELGWRIGADVPSDAYAFGLSVEDSAGNVVANYDAPLPQVFGCVPVALDVSAAAPGGYSVMIDVHTQATGERLEGDMRDGDDGERMLLATVTVE